MKESQPWILQCCMFCGLLSPRCGRGASARSDAFPQAVPTSLTSSLQQPPSHVASLRYGEDKAAGAEQLGLGSPLRTPHPPPRSSSLRTPLSLYLSRFPGKPELVRFWFPSEARRKQTVQKTISCPPPDFRCYSPEFRIELPRRRCQNRAKWRQQQA